MNRMASIGLSALILVLPYTASSQERTDSIRIAESQAQGLTSVGVSIGAGYLEEVRDWEPGDGEEYQIGVAGIVSLGDRWQLEASLELANARIESRMTEGSVRVLLPNSHDPNNPEIIESVRSTIDYSGRATQLRSTLSLAFRSVRLGDVDLLVCLGLTPSFVLSAEEKQNVEVDPEFSDNNPLAMQFVGPAPESHNWRHMAGRRDFQFGAVAGILFHVPVGDSFALRPGITYSRQFISLAENSDQRTQSVGGRLDMLWRL